MAGVIPMLHPPLLVPLVPPGLPAATDAPWLDVAWPGNPRVRALFTSRAGGVSGGPHGAGDAGGMNLGSHVGDAADAVAANRERLRAALSGARPVFLQQVHGVALADLDAADVATEPVADAAITTRPDIAATVLVADCLPVLFAAPGGSGVAAAHAGWRGLAGGVLEATLRDLCLKAGCGPERIQAALGPAIGPGAFEVGDEVRSAFVEPQPLTQSAFRPGSPGKWWADLWQLARIRLAQAGMDPALIAGGGLCTFADAPRFYSFRRQRVTGRQAACIWLESGAQAPRGR